MSKRLWLGLVFLAAAQVVFGQNCDNIVSDEANILGGRATGAVEEAAKTINAQGGDARVVTIKQLAPAPTLEAFLDARKGVCPSWQSTSGGIKNNLVVFAVSLNPRKLQIYYGPEMANIIGSSQNAIKMQYMAPAFKDGDWMRGFVQGETQVGMRIHAFNEAALHPTQTTTTVQNEATDLSGLWTALYWTLGIAFITFLGWFLLDQRGKGKRWKEAITAAQQDALQTAARVADMIDRLKAQYAEKKALGENVDAQIGAVNLVSEQFARMGNSESTNPSTTGLSADQYKTIANAYQRLMDQLITLQRDSKPSSKASYTPPPKHSSWSSSKLRNVGQTQQSTPPAPQPTSTHTTTNTTVFVDNSPAYVPIIVEEPVYRQREPDPEPVYSHSSYSSRSSRSDDSDSGSSSNWSSSSSSDSGSSSDYSSSDSSSSSDSGSSSDF